MVLDVPQDEGAPPGAFHKVLKISISHPPSGGPGFSVLLSRLASLPANLHPRFRARELMNIANIC